MTARSFIWEKVALAASGAWVGTTAACVICSIITFFAARLPSGLGVGSTITGAGAGTRAAEAGLARVAVALEAGADAFAGVGSAALVGGTLAAAFGVAGFGSGDAATFTAALAAGLTAVLTTVRLSGWAGAAALGAR